MQLAITGRHISLSEDEKEYISEKMGKYEKKVSGLTKAEVVVGVEKERHEIEIILHVAHNNPLVAHASGATNTSAMDMGIQKLDNLVSKMIGKRTNRTKVVNI